MVPSILATGDITQLGYQWPRRGQGRSGPVQFGNVEEGGGRLFVIGAQDVVANAQRSPKALHGTGKVA
jgi:hypothetical protein